MILPSSFSFFFLGHKTIIETWNSGKKKKCGLPFYLDVCLSSFLILAIYTYVLLYSFVSYTAPDYTSPNARYPDFGSLEHTSPTLVLFLTD